MTHKDRFFVAMCTCVIISSIYRADGDDAGMWFWTVLAIIFLIKGRIGT